MLDRPQVKRVLTLLRHGIVYWVPLALLLTAALARLAVPGFLDRLSLIWFDVYQRAQPRAVDPDLPIRIVDIDDRTLKRFGQWPWPRTQVALLVDKLREIGAGVVVFDVMFSEPDRTSPQLLLPLLTEAGVGREEAQRLLATMADPDQRLAEAIAKLPVVLGFALSPGGGTAPPLPKAGFAFASAAGADPLRRVPSYPQAISDLPVLQQAAAGNGFVNQHLDWDDVVRRVPLVLRLGDKPVPSLAAEALRLATGAHGYIGRAAGANTEQSFGQNSGLAAVKIGPLTVPTDGAGLVWLYFAPSETGRYISAADILDGTADAGRLSGGVVLIGTSAAGLNDLHATPMGPDMPGVEVHAQLIEQVLQGTFLARPDWAMGGEIVFALCAGLALILAMPRIGAVASAEAAAIAVILAFAASWFLFRDARLLVDPVYPVSVLTLVYLAAAILNHLHTERRQREIRHAFSRYMSPHYVELLARHPEQLVLGGETRTMTIMFCDIRGFTSLAEGLGAQELTQTINAFLSPMAEIVTAHQGTIDKYIGDCIMAFWNAPLDDPQHARHAVDAAQEMRRRLVELNRVWAAEAERTGGAYRPLRAGIGINTGDCCVGNFGSTQRFDYSLLGDPVNLASRLESLCKLYGVDLIIGEETAARLDDPDLIELDFVAVKGKTRAVRIFTLPAYAVDAARFPERHRALLAAYRGRDWDAALRLLDDDALAAEPEMAPVYDLFRRRIGELRRAPTPADWNGVFVAEEK